MDLKRSSRFLNLPLGAVRPEGWMLAQLQRDLTEGFAGCLDMLTERAATNLFKARIESSSQQFAWWDSETRGNWLWGYTMMALLAGNPEHQARATALLEALKNTQDSDGYLGIYSPASRYQHGDDENGELWGQGRALMAMLAFYELTGDPVYLRSVQAAADLTLKQYGPGRPYFRQPAQPDELTGMTHGLCYVDVVEWLYSLTGEDRYRDFGAWLYDDFSRAAPLPNDDIALANLLDRNRLFRGHAVHTVEHLRALFWADQVYGSHATGTALENALWKLRAYRLPSGAVLGDEGLHGLPTPDAGYEYCTLTELLYSLTSALQKRGDAELGDWIETLAFNAGQGARSADGSGLCYLSIDTRMAATADRPDSYSNLNGKHGRFKLSPTHEDVACCCNPNAVRFLPHYISRMWMRLAGTLGLAVVTYGSCTVRTEVAGVPVIIVEETNYPFSDEIHFTVSPTRPLEFALYLRKPGWVEQVEIDGVNAHADQGGYFVIDKAWSAGDTFSVKFNAQVHVTPYPIGEFAVRRGALQYVLQVTSQLLSTKDYPLSQFHDYQATPLDLEQAYTRLVLDEAAPGYGLVFEADPSVDMDRPWERSPVTLRAGATSLVPMGCTLLRRASFPLKLAGPFTVQNDR